MGARSAENFLIYQLIFINKFLSNVRAQRGKFFNISIDFYILKFEFKNGQRAMRFTIVKLLFSARSPPSKISIPEHSLRPRRAGI